MCCYAANLRLTHLTFNKADDYRPLYSIVLFYIVCFSSLKLMIVKRRSELCHTCFFTQIFLYKLFNVRYPLRKELSMSSTFSYIFNFVLCVFLFFPFFGSFMLPGMWPAVTGRIFFPIYSLPMGFNYIPGQCWMKVATV